MSTEPEAIEVFYMNWRGELRVRKLRPVGMVEWRTEPPWHPEPQWLMRAMDAETGQIRSFALNGLAGPDAVAPIAGPIAGWIAQMVNSALQAKLAKVSKLSRSRLKLLRELDAKVQAAETVRAELHTLGVKLGEVLAENMQNVESRCSVLNDAIEYAVREASKRGNGLDWLRTWQEGEPQAMAELAAWMARDRLNEVQST